MKRIITIKQKFKLRTIRFLVEKVITI